MRFCRPEYGRLPCIEFFKATKQRMFGHSHLKGLQEWPMPGCLLSRLPEGEMDDRLGLPPRSVPKRRSRPEGCGEKIQAHHARSPIARESRLVLPISAPWTPARISAAASPTRSFRSFSRSRNRPLESACAASSGPAAVKAVQFESLNHVPRQEAGTRASFPSETALMKLPQLAEERLAALEASAAVLEAGSPRVRHSA